MRKKLIEVGLPLEYISQAAEREKYVKHGHPSTLHLWWARRPLAACRAILFASLVDDPGEWPEEFPTEEEQNAERERLYELIKSLVRWETTDEKKPGSLTVVRNARYEIARSIQRAQETGAGNGRRKRAQETGAGNGRRKRAQETGRRKRAQETGAGNGRRKRAQETGAGNGRRKRAQSSALRNDPEDVLRFLKEHAPAVYDPFAGGGSIPLEAQRLGLRAVASDLNPISVLINKAIIEIPPKFHGRQPANPMAGPMHNNSGGEALASDILYYGRWLRDCAFQKIGHHYPKANLRDGTEATVLAWVWSRTVPCSNAACGMHTPLMKTLRLSGKPKNRHWRRRPFPNYETKRVKFAVQDHDGGLPETLSNGGTIDGVRNDFICVACQNRSKLEYVRRQAREGRMGSVMTAIVAEGNPGRRFLSPTDEHIEAAEAAEPAWRPHQEIPEDSKGVVLIRNYGVHHWHHLFTERQLLALTTFSDLIPEVCEKIMKDGADKEYADAVAVYLAMAISKYACYGSRCARWYTDAEGVARMFALQAIGMVWDYAESNPFSNSGGNFMMQVEWIAKTMERLPSDAMPEETFQADATTMNRIGEPVIATDPPYYNNISYAELSDFFYVWLRPILRRIHPDLFGGIMTPKAEEMIAMHRFGNKAEQKMRFEGLMSNMAGRIHQISSKKYPSWMFYAYKQEEEEREGVASTGWETFLNGVVKADLQITGTWPMRTEGKSRLRARESNTLASSIVLVCRPRPADAEHAFRLDFLAALKEELPPALKKLEEASPISPVDFPQAAIGPGMQIYSRYSSVERANGQPVTVREALVEINRVVAEYRNQTIGEVDPYSRFAWAWLNQRGFLAGPYGQAEVLAVANSISVSAMHEAVLEMQGGNVRLYHFIDYKERAPTNPSRRPMTAWEGCFRMAWEMNLGEESGGIAAAGEIMRRMRRSQVSDDNAEKLARALYSYFDRVRDSQSAVMFNYLVDEWKSIVEEADQGRLARQSAELSGDSDGSDDESGDSGSGGALFSE